MRVRALGTANWVPRTRTGNEAKKKEKMSGKKRKLMDLNASELAHLSMKLEDNMMRKQQNSNVLQTKQPFQVQQDKIQRLKEIEIL